MELVYIISHFPKKINTKDKKWWGQLGSNQRPSGYEPPALTTELCPQRLL